MKKNGVERSHKELLIHHPAGFFKEFADCHNAMG